MEFFIFMIAARCASVCVRVHKAIRAEYESTSAVTKARAKKKNYDRNYINNEWKDGQWGWLAVWPVCFAQTNTNSAISNI